MLQRPSVPRQAGTSPLLKTVTTTNSSTYLILDWPDMASSKRMPTLTTQSGEVVTEWSLENNNMSLMALGQRWEIEEGETLSEGLIYFDLVE
jgi:hypothetical protein